ncbi:unnamed protein product [Arabis nemorensis]|uniref:Uncharacterized protein n=1 Tax=Arabis nemorensis TaxID=586526 RepID=A0A565C747_9BRAS|nr:unnamed protein product [Arabis nemorensis]
MANLENRGAETEQRSTEERINLLEEQFKLKENAFEASSKMSNEKEKDLKNRIDDCRVNSMIFVNVAKSDYLQDLVNEVASLREQNGLMEMELK